MILLIAGVATGYLLRGSEQEPGGRFVSAEPLGPRAAEVSATLERHAGDSATLHVSEMPALDRDEVYEVWVQRGGVMEPRSTFVLGLDGTAEAAVPGPLDGANAVFVTAERRARQSPADDPAASASAPVGPQRPDIVPRPWRLATDTPAARPTSRAPIVAGRSAPIA